MDTYDKVTNRILEELERGCVPWRRPWKDSRGAYNLLTGRSYSLLNQLMLGEEGGYLTFNQVNALRGRIQKGEKAHTVVFWKVPEVTDEESDEEEVVKRKPPILRRYSVFHFSQVEGIELKEPKPIEKENRKADEIFSSYINREKILLNPNSTQAFYSPATDSIHLPPIEAFESEEAYWSTAYHEAAHSTGHAKRLDRKGICKATFGSQSYSFEELVGEMTAGFMGNQLGFLSDDEVKNSAAYIESWLKVLKEDKRMVVYAAAKAEKAAKYILNEKS